MINPRKLDRVAQASCRAAGVHNEPYGPDFPQKFGEKQHCPHCYNRETGKEECSMWQSFRSEAEAAIKAIKGF
jgi:hypothetical protein